MSRAQKPLPPPMPRAVVMGTWLSPQAEAEKIQPSLWHRTPPLGGAAGLGAKQVPEKSLELWVLEGLQAARDPEGDIPKRPFRRGLCGPKRTEARLGRNS